MMNIADLLQVIRSAGVLVTILLSVLAAYWALRTRKALAVQLYRNQALGIGLFSLGFAFLNTTLLLNISTGLVAILGFLPFIFFFYWVDYSVSATRAADPLLRDVFLWRRLRIVLWPVLMFSYASLFFVQADPVVAACLPTPSCGLATVLFFIPTLLPLASGAIYLPLSARRSSDSTFRRHLKWFGLFALCIITATMLFFVFQFDFAPAALVFALSGYCLYESALSLLPLRRLQTKQPRSLP